MILELRFETQIRASPESVFNLLAELRGYEQWLPGSVAFHGTTHISEQYDLGFFDHETGRIPSAENPFGAKVLVVSMGQRNTSNLSLGGVWHETRTSPHDHRRPTPGALAAI